MGFIPQPNITEQKNPYPKNPYPRTNMLTNQKNFKPLHADLKDVLVVVEDSEQDYEMLLRAVKKTDIECAIHHCETGEEALDYLANDGKYPSLILLDLNLPGTDGRDILKTIKMNPALKSIPVVIFSTSSNLKDIEVCYENGANSYVVKPMDVSRLQECIQILLLHWLKVNVTYPN